MSTINKKVIYAGTTYMVTLTQEGYANSRMTINGQDSSQLLQNKHAINLEFFKNCAVEAIKEFEARKQAIKLFDDWDGRLDEESNTNARILTHEYKIALRNFLNDLFEQIKHGDKEHQDWLKNKIDEFYANRIR